MSNQNKPKQNLNRRDFLKTSGLSAFGFLGATLLPGAAMLPGLLGAEEALAAAPGDHTLIYVFLRGGMDALSMFPPIDPQLRAAYEAKRPDIKMRVTELRPGLDFGINSALTGMKELFDKRELSVVYGIGSITNTTSHFNQMAYIEGGSSKKRLAQGFLQRFVDQMGGTQNSSDLVAVERNIPRTLQGSNFVLQYQSHKELASISGAGVIPGLSKQERLANNFTAVGRVARVGRSLAGAVETVYPVLAAADENRGGIPLTPFREIARLMQLPKAPKVITTSLGGWDLHTNLVTRFLDGDTEAAAIGLSDSLVGLKNAIGAARWQKTTVVVMSEFGRRIVQNGSFGADHGRGGAAIVAGGAVKGGQIIQAPDLAKRLIDAYNSERRAQAQVPVDFDFRILMGELFKARFGLLETAEQNQIHGGETAVFLENYLDKAQLLSAADTANPIASALYPTYDPRAAKAKLAKLF